jgi:hypothetical protein
LDTLLLKQNKLPVLDITGFFFRMSTQVKAEVIRTQVTTLQGRIQGARPP